MLTMKLSSRFAAVLLAATLAGCGSDTKKSTTADKAASSDKKAEHADDHAGHDHPEEGPHHGHLIELGNGKYHGELLHDEKTVTIYILDGSAKQEVPVKLDSVALNVVLEEKPTHFQMKAVNPVDGMAAQFTLENAELVDALEGDTATKGRLSVTINDKPYVGSIDHGSHGAHDHEHGDHEDSDHDDHAKDDHEEHDHE